MSPPQIKVLTELNDETLALIGAFEKAIFSAPLNVEDLKAEIRSK